MSYGGGYDDNAGGYGSQPTPSRDKPRRDYDSQTLIPVTIKMILDAMSSPSGDGASGDLVLADERPIHMIKLVCAIRTSEARSTNTFLDVEDGTGIFQVKVFSSGRDDGSGDADCSAMQQMRMEACQDNQYVRIIGQVREFDGTRQIIANDVRVLSSGDELSYHYLEVAHSYEKHLKRKQQQGQGIFGGGMMGYGIGNVASSGGPPPHGGGVGLSAHGGNLGGGSRINDAVIAFIQSEGCEFTF
eukprot:CCRYP_004653-RA/>CCRYP_004653-RA protein AED:0.05 eAED:0.05 QI:199/1/1/1/1/1/2/707/243